MNSGFTLIELLITTAIIAILAGIAVPTYQSYKARSYYSEIIQSVGPYVLGVNLCYQTQASLTNCKGGSFGIPANITKSAGAGISKVAVAKGKITVTPVAQNGILAADTYILTPTATGNILHWAVSGGCVKKGYC